MFWKGGVPLFGTLLGKILVLVFHSKAIVVTGAVLTAVVVTGTIGGQAVNLLITPVAAAPLAFPTDPLVQIDEPKLGAFVDGVVEVTGWAVDRNGTDGPDIDRVTVYLDGVSKDKKLGEATYGLDRPDVVTSLDEPKYLKSGWTFSWTAGTVEGNHTLYVLARSKSGRTSQVLRDVNDPLVRFESPAAGAKVHQEDLVEVAGWAIDRSDLEDDGISSVTLYLDAKDDGHKLGGATLDRPSSDLADVYGERFDISGWTFGWDVAQTATGEHTLLAVARSSVSQHETTVTRMVEVKALEQDEDLGPGCSDWAHERNAAWFEVHAYWQTVHSDLQGLRKEGKGGKGTAQAAVNDSRSTLDLTVRTAHRDIQALALSHKCQAGLDYASIITAAKSKMDDTVAAAKLAVANLPAEAPKKGNNGKGKP
jgi:Big-like domain-containing protein